MHEGTLTASQYPGPPTVSCLTATSGFRLGISNKFPDGGYETL